MTPVQQRRDRGARPAGWWCYVPAVVLSLTPIVSATKLYTASVPVPPLQILRAGVVMAGAVALVALGLALLPGSPRRKGSGLAAAVLAAGGVPMSSRLLELPAADALVGLSLLAAIAGALWLIGRAAPRLLDRFLVVFAAMAAVLAAYAGYSVAARAWRATDFSVIDPGAPPALGGGDAPDVVHVIFDGLGRLDVLGRTYGLDAPRIRARLEEAGLRIHAQAVANYSQTFLSVASTLSMDYLDQIPRKLPGTANRRAALALIHGSPVVRALKDRGYRFTLLSSGYEALADHPLADEGITGPILFGQFESYVWPRTPLRVLPIGAWSYEPHRARQAALLEALAAFTPGDRPRYVLAHVMLPHPPFIVSADGSARTPPGVFSILDGSLFEHGEAAYREGYAAQASFVFDRLAGWLERWRALPRPPLVIVQGDHGPGLGYDMGRPAERGAGDRMSIFLGISDPSEDVTLPASPVNIYRAVFAGAFGVALAPLPDRSFVSGWNEPYRFADGE